MACKPAGGGGGQLAALQGSEGGEEGLGGLEGDLRVWGGGLRGDEADFRIVVIEKGVEGLADGEVGLGKGRWGPEGELEGFGGGVARVEGLG